MNYIGLWVFTKDLGTNFTADKLYQLNIKTNLDASSGRHLFKY